MALPKDHKGTMIFWIVISFWEHFPLITKFTCSKLDTNFLNVFGCNHNKTSQKEHQMGLKNNQD
jgi:hypothetical protein